MSMAQPAHTPTPSPAPGLPATHSLRCLLQSSELAPGCLQGPLLPAGDELPDGVPAPSLAQHGGQSGSKQGPQPLWALWSPWSPNRSGSKQRQLPPLRAMQRAEPPALWRQDGDRAGSQPS